VKQTTCLYFALDGEAPSQVPILYLNGDGVEDAEGTTKVNNMCFPSTVSPSYAPAGKSLASVSLIGIPPQTDEEVAADVKAQLAEWFGPSVQAWRLLKTYRIPYCQVLLMCC
jgi:phytoene dehydrogenase-like protein